MTKAGGSKRRRIALGASALALFVLIGAFLATRLGPRTAEVARASVDASGAAPDSWTGATEAAPPSNREIVVKSAEGASAMDAVAASDGDGAAANQAVAHAPIFLHGSVLLAGPEDSYASVLLVDRVGNRLSRNSNHDRVRAYAFEGVAPGEYVLEVFAWGHRSVRRTIVLRSDEPDRREDFTLESDWILDVRIVTSNGADLMKSLENFHGARPWIAVFATMEPPGDTLPRSFSMDRPDLSIGRLTLGKSWDGLGGLRRLELTTDPPIFVSAAIREQVLATRRVDARVPEVKLVVDAERVMRSFATLTLVVVDEETGAAATKASVQMKTNQTSEQARHPDDSGRLTFEGRMPGLYELQITQRDRAFTTVTADLAPGQTTDLGVVRIGKGTPIRGRCVDEHGEELPDVLPDLMRADDDPDAPHGPMTAHGAGRDAERGGFVFDGLCAGRYELAPKLEHFPGEEANRDTNWAFVPIVVDTRKGPVENLVLVARRPVPLVLRPTSDVLEGVSFDVRTSEGVLVQNGQFRGKVPERLEIAPGEYRLRLSRKGALIREAPFTLGADPLEMEVDP